MFSADFNFLTGIRDILQQLSHDQVAKVRDGIPAYIHHQSFREEIRTEVTRLASTISTIEDHFAYIRRYLWRIQDVMDKDYEPVWNRLRDEYTTLKQESQKTANDLKSHVQGFLDLVTDLSNLQDSAQDFTGHLAYLSAYIEDLDKFQNRADPIAKRFTVLQQEVQGFAREFTASGFTVGVEGRLIEMKNNIEERMTTLQSDLDSVSSIFINVWGDLKLNFEGLLRRGGDAEDANDLDFFMMPAVLLALAPKTAKGFLLHVLTESATEPEHLEFESVHISGGKVTNIEGGLEKLYAAFDGTNSGLCAVLTGIGRLLLIDAISLQRELQQPTWNNAGVLTVAPLYHTLLFVIDNYTLEFGRISRARRFGINRLGVW